MILPIGDENPARRLPVVTVTFIVINVIVFFAFEAPLEGGELACFIYRWAAVPRELLTFDTLPPGSVPDASCPITLFTEKNVLVSAVTSMFLHGGLLHLLFNMLFLWIFGNNVEDRLGHIGYLLYYLAGGIVSVYTFALVNPSLTTPLLGASGAIAAVLGGYFLMFPRARVHTYVPFPLYLFAFLVPGAVLRSFFFFFAVVDLPSWLVLGFWFLSQMTSVNEAANTGVAYEAHIAGFVAGVLFTLLLRPRGRQPPMRQAVARP
ncbi:MAG: rhomboid family intramembrane serine protease [Actinomycetota bacterium]|nr:rhomboid family intramembrane serine protease [Actinomycetota bacterium]